jgi:PEGA domain
MCRMDKLAILAVLLVTCAGTSHAQDVAESAAATSNSSAATRAVQPATMLMATPAQDNKSAYMVVPDGPSQQKANRKDFEDNAGPNAGKLLLRSTPSGADIFINDRLVGRTPLLMVIAPGKYTIRMRGTRQDSGSKVVGLMPKETQTVVITLKERYPSSIIIH